MKKYKNKDWLQNKYIKEGLGIYQIAPLCNCHPRTIHLNLVKFGIPRRKCGVTRHTEETKALIGLSSTGRQSNLGHKASEETKRKMSLKKIGANHPNWKGGLTSTIRLFRKTKEYQNWRINILKRDGYTCQIKGCRKKTKIVHHKMSAKDYPELRVEIKNGVAVCLTHHVQIHTKKKIYKLEFKNAKD